VDHERDARPLRILVAEDSVDIRSLWQLWLTLSGFIVDEAENGAEAFASARRQPPDLILIDLEMPVMSGVEAIQHLRADPLTAAIPIIVMTARGGSEAFEQARVAGADTYLQKPVLPDDLLQHIQETYDRPRGSEMVRRLT
jgi:CheY-like chemotaxis protein